MVALKSIPWTPAPGKWGHWNTAAWNIPHVGDNCPTRPYHPRHFSDRLARIGKKGDHQSHHSNIEAVVSEGQILSIARAEIRHLRAGPCPSIGELIIGRIDRRDSTGRRASNQLVCECAVSAADIEPREILRSIDPIQKCFTNNSTPSAHQPLVRCSVCEELVRFTHAIMCDGDAAPPQTEYGPRGIISRHRHYLKSFEKGATLALGHSRPGRAISRSSHVHLPRKPTSHEDAPDFVEVGEAGIAVDHAMRRRLAVQSCS